MVTGFQSMEADKIKGTHLNIEFEVRPVRASPRDSRNHEITSQRLSRPSAKAAWFRLGMLSLRTHDCSKSTQTVCEKQITSSESEELVSPIEAPKTHQMRRE
jgi:hypothetical protein